MNVINGSELALILKKKGIKQKTICEKLDIDQTLVSKYYNNVHTMPGDFIIKVAKLAGLEISDLIKSDDLPVNIVNEPSEIYEKSDKAHQSASKVDLLVDGLSISEYIKKIEQRLAEMERSVIDLQKKSFNVMEVMAM
ncbi:MAG TPA: helix-turn-helix transcriptional regulator [Saprospiraceae bacterium]|nr:helix-turn-helix transcriptional regulator [Saprospiraceae bacterium]HMU05898.1 helix-turn-helix transcriptional regulator [Saprospiraceae bacterium]